MDIVRLQDGDSRVSAYCLPMATGAIHEYFELAKAIGPGHLIYGIQFADRVQPEKFKEFSSLREMATAMLPEFLAHHRDGPICLIGYSFAACLAIELAQQLIGLGKTVPLVVIINRTPSSGSFTPFMRMKHFLRYFGPWAIKVATRAVTDTNYRSRFYSKALRKLTFPNHQVAMNHKIEGTSWYANLPEDLQDYIKNNLAASHNYRFEGVYRNKILLFRGAAQDARPLQCLSAGDYGWGDITGASVDVVYLPGDHVSVMQDPNVVHIANALRPVLSECEFSR